MIDNIVLLITGTLHQRAIGDLLPRCHPLGSFEQLGAITIADTPAQLYNAVLVDTPLGIEFNHSLNNIILLLSAPYFIDCISEHDLDELNVEIIRSTLYKVSQREEFTDRTNSNILFRHILKIFIIFARSLVVLQLK
jgi:V-type H+-transporting ATPase subunit d